jgi:hypothetical protein
MRPPVACSETEPPSAEKDFGRSLVRISEDEQNLNKQLQAENENYKASLEYFDARHEK